MIRVRRPPTAPAVLRTKGIVTRKADCDAFAAEGKKEFAFNSGIYGHASVKKALVKAQHEKCCFCESKVTHVSSGHVEHFRPKGGVRQRPHDPLSKPGYFWLAYDWTNLLFCCEVCNSRFKKNLFPLANPAGRARTPEADLALEQPLFVNPALEDPAAHIGFREEYPFAVGGSARGEATWRALGLAREELAEVRRDHLATVRGLLRLRELTTGPVRHEAEAHLKRLSGERAEWSAMVRAAIAAQQ